MKKQNDITKGQYYFFKDQINVNNNNTEDCVKTKDVVKTEDGEIMDNVHKKYIDDRYKDLINDIFTDESTLFRMSLFGDTHG